MSNIPSGVGVNADASTDTLMVVPRSAVVELTCVLDTAIPRMQRRGNGG